jgi:hypothetical protein
MLEIFQFIFSSFWVFIGTAILLSIVGKLILGLVAILFTRSNVNIQ